MSNDIIRKLKNIKYLFYFLFYLGVSNSDMESDSSAGDGGDVKKAWGRRKRQKHNVSETEVMIPLSQG